MTVAAIRAALETALNAISPSIGTAWENAEAYTPVQGTPYQRVNLLLAQPDNGESGATYGQRGFLQVMLCYPVGTGPAAAGARAELLRTTFARATQVTSGGVVTTIEKTPEIAPAMLDGDRYCIPVRIPFFAQL